MKHTMHRETIVETLLNTLEAERYVRGPLLLTIVDELSAGDGLEIAAQAARDILAGLQNGEMGHNEFVARIRALRELVEALAGPPESSQGLIGEALSRAVPRASAQSHARASAA